MFIEVYDFDLNRVPLRAGTATQQSQLIFTFHILDGFMIDTLCVMNLRQQIKQSHMPTR